MKARWQELETRFAALQKREKASVAVAAVFAVAMIGYSVWVEPAQKRLAAVQKQVAKDKIDVQNLKAQVAMMQAQLKDPDQPNRNALAQARVEIEAKERSLRQYESLLVSPEQAPRLLQSLLRRNRGLELVSLQTLPPTPLLDLAPKGDASARDAKEAPRPRLPAAAGENIQKHGIEIKLAGNYLDLLNYVAELEQLPQKLLWDSMSLTVQAYPRSELTLTVSTLSLDSIWLVF